MLSYPVLNVYVHKSMVVVSTLLSMFFRPTRVFHVVHRDISTVNPQLNNIMNILEMIYSEKDIRRKDEIYRRYRDRILRVILPPKDDYEVIELGLPLFPSLYTGFIRDILSGRAPKPDDKSRFFDYFTALKAADFVEEDDGWIKPTDRLKTLKNIFL